MPLRRGPDLINQVRLIVGIDKMTGLRIAIFTAVIIGIIFILASRKRRTYLDSQIVSANSKFVIGFFLIFMAIIFASAAFLKGVL